MDVDAIVKVVSGLGVPVAILVGIAVGTWKSGRYAAVRLFDKDEGLVTKIVRKHAEFIDVLVGTNARNTSATEKIDGSLEDLKGALNTVLTEVRNGHTKVGNIADRFTGIEQALARALAELESQGKFLSSALWKKGEPDDTPYRRPLPAGPNRSAVADAGS